MNTAKSKLTGIILFALFGIALVTQPLVSAETRDKLRTGSQRIFTNQDLNDSTDGTTGASLTVDLSGGDLDECSFQVNTTSGTSGTLDFAIQISADGGSTWAQATTFTQISTHTTAVNNVKQTVAVAPGTKMRVIPTISAGATYYNINMWTICQSR